MVCWTSRSLSDCHNCGKLRRVGTSRIFLALDQPSRVTVGVTEPEKTWPLARPAPRQALYHDSAGRPYAVLTGSPDESGRKRREEKAWPGQATFGFEEA